MSIILLYALTKVFAFTAALAALCVLVISGHPYWAILPAALSVILGFSCFIGGGDSDGAEE